MTTRNPDKNYFWDEPPIIWQLQLIMNFRFPVSHLAWFMAWDLPYYQLAICSNPKHIGQIGFIIEGRVVKPLPQPLNSKYHSPQMDPPK